MNVEDFLISKGLEVDCIVESCDFKTKYEQYMIKDLINEYNILNDIKCKGDKIKSYLSLPKNIFNK